MNATEETSINDNKHAIFFHTCLWSLTIGSIVILYTAYHTSNTQTIVTGISGTMLCIELLAIAYKYPPHYEWVRTYMEISFRINICQLIVASSFIYYINYVEFYTYFALLCVFTLPILVLSATPILRDV
jgi:peptidoglycan/LPS O-acetylase OafA/YrhL